MSIVGPGNHHYKQNYSYVKPRRLLNSNKRISAAKTDIWQNIQNNAWVTVNNDFLVTSEVIWQWKSLANHHTSDQNIVIHGNECIISFLTRYFMSWAHSFANNNRRSFISSLSPRKVFSALELWLHLNWSVTSQEREVLVLRCHIRRLFSHAQIGAKAIFTSE